MSVKKNIIANYSGNIFMLIINILLVPLYLKYLSVEEYGIITFFASLMSVFVILDIGLGLTINKEVATSQAEEKKLNSTSDIIRSFEIVYWSMALLIGLILFSFSEWIAVSWLNVEYIKKDDLTLIVSLMGLALIFRWPISFYENVLSGFQKMVKINTIKIIIGIFNFGFLFFLFSFFNLEIKGYFLFLALVYFIQTGLLTSTVWKVKNLTFSKAKFYLSILKRNKSYILGIGIYSVTGTLYVAIDRFVISNFFLTSELAYYSLASMASLSLFQLVYPISAALFPKFVENNTKGKNEESLFVFRKGYQLCMVLVFSFSSILFIFQESIFIFWTQNELVTSKSLVFLNPVLLGTVFYTLHILIISIYTALGKTKEINILYLFVFFLFFGLILIFSFRQNMLFIAYSWCFSNAVLLILTFLLAIRLFSFNSFVLIFKEDIILPFSIYAIIVFISSIIELPQMTFIGLIIIIMLSLAFLLAIFTGCSHLIRNIILSKIKQIIHF